MVQSPGARALDDPAQYPRLEAWVKGLAGAFASDKRILGWDVWNEPDNTNAGSYTDPPDKVERVLALLPRVRMGALRRSEAAAHQRRVEGRLVVSRQAQPDGEDPA
jgi:hypothetical protein